MNEVVCSVPGLGGALNVYDTGGVMGDLNPYTKYGFGFHI